MEFEIKHHFTNSVMFTAEIEASGDTPFSVKLGLAVRAAVEARANLAGAYLADAYLARANLAGANLAGAYLACANLACANLACANLADAYLARANLAGANLAGAYLARANLAGANLAGANLTRAYLACANLAGRIIDGGLRSDGYRFLLTRTEPGEFRVKAGCRNFTLTEAAVHWTATRPPGESLGDETRVIIAHMVGLARTRGWKSTPE
jgi:hypothetical protein